VGRGANIFPSRKHCLLVSFFCSFCHETEGTISWIDLAVKKGL